MDNQKYLDLKSSVVNLKKEFAGLEKNIFNCYLKPESVFVEIKQVRDLLTAFLVPNAFYQKLLFEADNDETDLCCLKDVFDFLKKYLDSIDSAEMPRSINGWFDGISYVSRNNLKRKINSQYNVIIKKQKTD
ncbi:MAG: hypothetical protein RLY40_44 [Pseudomonadota bacterium]|jgi:hypothetical protein